MSFLLVAQDILQTAAADVAQVGSAVTAGNLAAALPTTEVAAAGADEVSAAIAALFGAHAQQYQAVAARAATYHEQFVSTLNAAAASYAGAEATIATSMRGALGAVTAPGTGLTPLGQQQANTIAKVLAPQGPFAGIYASQLIRTQLTAAPLAGQLGMNVGVLSGLNEINAGVFSGSPEVSPAGLL